MLLQHACAPWSMHIPIPPSINQFLLLEEISYQYSGLWPSASTESHLLWPWVGRAAPATCFLRCPGNPGMEWNARLCGRGGSLERWELSHLHLCPSCLVSERRLLKTMHGFKKPFQPIHHYIPRRVFRSSSVTIRWPVSSCASNSLYFMWVDAVRCRLTILRLTQPLLFSSKALSLVSSANPFCLGFIDIVWGSQSLLLGAAVSIPVLSPIQCSSWWVWLT